jgi:hypothetical protein
MISQFMMELQEIQDRGRRGLAQDPPLQPPAFGEWSGKPAIE